MRTEFMRLRVAGHTLGKELIVRSLHANCGDIVDGIELSHDNSGGFVMDRTELLALADMIRKHDVDRQPEQPKTEE